MDTLVCILASVSSIPHQIFITANNALNDICNKKREKEHVL